MAARSYSRNSGTIWCETEIGSPRARNCPTIFFSCSEFAKEKSSEIATLSALLARIFLRSLASSPSAGESRTSPSALIRSLTPKRNSCGTMHGAGVAIQSYRCCRACRPIAIVSSNPAVVTNATRAPSRSSRALVPIVVPCRTSTLSPDAIS